MFENHVRKKMKAGEPTIGSFLGLASPHVTGLMAHAGFDWLVIETEHNSMDLSQVEHCIMAMSGTNTVPLVRVPHNDMNFIQRALDIGAMGIIAPMIRTPQDAEKIVNITRYPTEGNRGFGPLRAPHYTLHNPEYFAEINENIIVGFILETKEAVENLDEIAQVPGVDALIMGQCDLSLSYGLHPLKYNEHPEVCDAVKKALDVGRKHNVATGLNTFSPENVKDAVAAGHTFISYGPEYALLNLTVRQGIESFRNL
jgi:4-hydroxy-2-oxoheptanedioate aldolase